MTAAGVKDRTPGTDSARPGGRWGRWAIGIGLALALLLAVLLVVPVIVWLSRDAILNSDWVRAEMLARAESALNRRPQWEGGVKLDWITEPHTDVHNPVPMSQLVLTLGAGTLPSPAGFSGQPLSAWNRIQLVIDGGTLRSWANGDSWQIRKLKIDGLVLHGETTLAGEHNWEGLFANPVATATPTIRIEQLLLPQMAAHRQLADDSRFSLITQGLQFERVRLDPAGVWQAHQIQLTTQDGAQLNLADVMLTEASQTPLSRAAAFTLRWQIKNLALRGLPLRELSVPAWLTESEAPLVIPRATGGLAMDGDGTKISVESMQFDTTQINGEIFSTPAGGDLRLRLGQLQLDPYLSPSTSSPGDTNTGPPDKRPLDALRNLGLRGDIAIDELSWGGDRIRGLKVHISP